MIKIAVASPPFPKSLNDGLFWLDRQTKEAAEAGARVVCFPESFLPGYPGMAYPQEDRTAENLRAALENARGFAQKHSIAIVLPMDWYEGEKLLNVAHVLSSTGEWMGYQSKNQLDPSEDLFWAPGSERKIFDVDGLRFGITICHEGFRYPESVRWAARNGAQIIFHPHFTGSNADGVQLTEWGAKSNPYYEKAMMLRAMENTVYFASSNYASIYPESASCIIDPQGNALAVENYGSAGIIVADIDPDKATGLLAKRFRSELYYSPEH